VNLSDFDAFSLIFNWHSANDGREYVYGPDYVDEFVAQVDRYGATTYFLQDANYNVVALLDEWGHVLEQYTWEPYGEPAAIDRTTAGHPNNRVGHQGLFFERLDATDPDDTFPLQVGAFGVYHNRNRTYLPSYGRFMQPDPYGTGLSLPTVCAFMGHSPLDGLGPFEAQALYGEGMHLYLYAGSDPVNGRDPTGLFTYADILSTMSVGAEMYGAADTAMTFQRAIAAFVAGASLQSTLLTLTVELAVDRFGGKLFDPVLDAARPLLNKLSRTLAKGLKSATKLDWELHHAFPKFLRGDRKGLLVPIPKKMQTEYHTGLLRALNDKGIRPPKGMSWEKYLENDKEWKKALNVLMDYTRSYDQAKGTNLLNAIWQEMAYEWWT
jgi:hypothetical protein